MSFQTVDVIKTFSSYSKTWNSKNQFILKKDGETRRLFKVLEKIVTEGMQILDIGSGSGKVITYLAGLGKRLSLFASDVSTHMISNLLPKLSTDRTIRCFLTDAQNMCFASDFFDIVTAQQVLHHLPQPACAIQEISRVLKPGGFAILLTVGKEYHANAFPYQGESFLADPFGRVDLEQIKALCKNTELSLLQNWDDFFEMEFMNFDSYYDFLCSIGSLRKFYKYKLPPVNSKDIIVNQLQYQGVLLDENSPVKIVGHYVTIFLQKNR